jgi:hypothetical protein
MPVLWQWHASGSSSDCSNASSSPGGAQPAPVRHSGRPLPAWHEADSEIAEPPPVRRKLEPYVADSGSSSPSDAASSSGSGSDDDSSWSQSSSGRSVLSSPRQNGGSLTAAAMSLVFDPTSNVEQRKDKTDPPRVRRMLKSGGGCRCTRKCYRSFLPENRFAKLMVSLTLFWSMTKQGQDALLWSLSVSPSRDDDEESGDSASKPRRNLRRLWRIDGAIAASSALVGSVDISGCCCIAS